MTTSTPALSQSRDLTTYVAVVLAAPDVEGVSVVRVERVVETRPAYLAVVLLALPFADRLAAEAEYLRLIANPFAVDDSVAPGADHVPADVPLSALDSEGGLPVCSCPSRQGGQRDYRVPNRLQPYVRHGYRAVADSAYLDGFLAVHLVDADGLRVNSARGSSPNAALATLAAITVSWRSLRKDGSSVVVDEVSRGDLPGGADVDDLKRRGVRVS